jgi:hypothetical protein
VKILVPLMALASAIAFLATSLSAQTLSYI